MRRKNHNVADPHIAWRLPKDISDNIPFGMLKAYVSVCEIADEVKEAIYAKCTDGSLDPNHDLTELNTAMESCKRNGKIEAFRNLYQAYSLLKKYPFAGNKAECRENAINKFFEAERMCKRTNRRLRFLRAYPSRIQTYHKEVSLRARDIIARALGTLRLDKIFEAANPGPGLTHDLGFRRPSETTKYFKYTDNVSCTQNARFFVKGLIAKDPHWLQTMVRKHEHHKLTGVSFLQNELIILDRATYVVSGNRITFVPKNSTTDRTIAVEPAGNVMLQAGVGSYIKDRLVPLGINLRDQSKNQHFAYLGSLPNQVDEFSTIDMAMASDTLSYETVKDLLPSDWFALLCLLRSDCGTLRTSDGEILDVEYEKFSSMGNGYTFELESLIFYALARAVMEQSGFIGRTASHLSVFGDDVVCRRSFVDGIISIYRHYGFKINLDKSFIEGPFKESCGRDYLRGVDVRPFFLRRKVKTLSDLHFVCNSIMYKALISETLSHLDAYEFLFACIPRDLLLPGPLGLSDIRRIKGLNGLDRVHWKSQQKFGDETYLDDLESCLRVPLSWALEHGHYKLSKSPRFQGIKFREIKASPRIFTKKYRGLPYTDLGRYHIFLQGVSRGDIVLRGVTQRSVRWNVSSSWDGNVPRRVLSYSLL